MKQIMNPDCSFYKIISEGVWKGYFTLVDLRRRNERAFLLDVLNFSGLKMDNEGFVKVLMHQIVQIERAQGVKYLLSSPTPGHISNRDYIRSAVTRVFPAQGTVQSFGLPSQPTAYFQSLQANLSVIWENEKIEEPEPTIASASWIPMPEYPDVEVNVECLKKRVVDRPLTKIRIVSPFVVRTFDPPINSIDGRVITDVTRLGKQITFSFDNNLTLVIHLMIAGRLRWKEPNAKLARKLGLAAFDFDDGTLIFTEAGSKKRAAIHLVPDSELSDFDRGGLEVFDADIDAFRERLFVENHTLKRSMTDPRLFSGIGNAYSDEILLRAGLSPLKHSTKLSDEEVDRLYHATLETHAEWKERLLEEVGDGFPDKVTAFHKQMAAHGKYGEPCPVCDSPIQRIRYAQNECNYCATCQTDGKVLADRGLSRLLKQDWPRTLEELDELRKPKR